MPAAATPRRRTRGDELGRPAMAKPGAAAADSWEYSLRKYLLLLASLVATVTYGAAFNPPGGVWQDADPAAGRIAGDPIIRETNYRRYLAFFYSNATAFASSLVVIVLVLILSILHDRGRMRSPAPLRVLRAVMVLDIVSLMAAYAAGVFRDVLTAVYSLVLLTGVVVYLVVQLVAPGGTSEQTAADDARLRKVPMLLATFAVSVTYMAGLNAPGGFWDDDEQGHNPGDAILKGGRHGARLKAFFVCNTTAFVASLLILVMLLGKRLRFGQGVRSLELELYGLIALTLLGLVAAYAAGSSREVDTTVYVSALVGAVVVCILLQVVIIDAINQNCLCKHLKGTVGAVSTWLRTIRRSCLGQDTNNSTSDNEHEPQQTKALDKARSLVVLLATLAAAITYQAGLNPPGGLWQGDGVGADGRRYMAGDPILLTTNPRRYKAFYYCNSIAFVASLVAIALARMNTLHHHNALEVAMILDLFGLIVAYAAGSCRDVTTSVYAVAIAGAVLVYVVIHVTLLTLDHKDGSSSRESELVEKRRKRLLLFAILAATITYQAGLTPPGGFVDTDEHAGDPVLLNNYPRRYAAFFYCNTVSFMLSIALIILLVNPNLYRPAIRSNALSVCTAAGMAGIMGGYAAGCTQHISTSIYILVLAAFVLCAVVVLLVMVFFVKHWRKQEEVTPSDDTAESPGEGDREGDVIGAIEESATAKLKRLHTSMSKRRKQEEVTPTDTAESPGEGDREGDVIGAIEESATAKLKRLHTSMSKRRKQEEVTPSDTAESPGEGDREGDVIGAIDESAKHKRLHAKRKYLMLLGILAASVTYQAGLAPPGGAWQSNSIDDGTYTAGDPVMHDNRRARYLAFFYSNSTSFVASIVVIVLLLPPSLHEKPWWLGVMNVTIVLDLLGLLIAYAAGSSRTWKTSVIVSALVVAVMLYFVFHVTLSYFSRKRKRAASASAAHPNGVGNGGYRAQVAPTLELCEAA